ncbi:hypothetical protein J7K93_09140 [bacterium]|nr:hypothetical protein [bacterium]
MDKGISYIISERVFSQFTGYHRGIVLCYEVNNGESPEKLVNLLRSEESALKGRLKIDQILENERISSWREAYRKFGAKPSKFRPSMEAMARRVLRGDKIPSINKLVDIGNIISLRHLVPVGGHSIDSVKNDLSLMYAQGDEIFIPFGSDKIENPLPGEIIFTEGKTVLTRRWTWRQANHTILIPETKNVEFNVDGLPPVNAGEVEQVCAEIIDLLKKYCGGKYQHEMLSEKQSKIALMEQM